MSHCRCVPGYDCGCNSYDSTPSEAEKLRARISELEAALTNLLVWADWQRARHPHPMMNEPNTGARSRAREVLEVKP